MSEHVPPVKNAWLCGYINILFGLIFYNYIINLTDFGGVFFNKSNFILVITYFPTDKTLTKTYWLIVKYYNSYFKCSLTVYDYQNFHSQILLNHLTIIYNSTSLPWLILVRSTW